MSDNHRIDVDAEVSPFISIIKTLTIEEQKIAAAVITGMNLQSKLSSDAPKSHS